MIIFQVPPVVVQQTIVQQLEAIFLPALSTLVLAAVGYLVWKLNSLQTAQATHNAASSAKLNAVVAVTPGAAAHLAANPPAPPQA